MIETISNLQKTVREASCCSNTIVVKAVQAFPIQTHRFSQLCYVFVDIICDEVTLTFVNGLDFQLLPQCRVKYEQEGLEDFCVAST